MIFAALGGIAAVLLYYYYYSIVSPVANATTSPVHPIVALQRQNNKSSKDSWKFFAFHRQKVMQLVQDTASMARSRVEEGCHAIFFGPGNCNDLHLSQLLKDFESIALVDIDNETVKEGVDRQLVSIDDNDRIVVSPSMDLSHTVSQTKDWVHSYHKSPPQHVLETALKAIDKPMTDWLNQVGAPLSVQRQGGYDVAVTLCLLSQFSSSLGYVLDEASRSMDLVVLAVAVRRRHIHQLVQSLRPGGYGLMVIDMVSSGTLPELLAADNDPATIEQLTVKAEQTGNFFHGTKRLAVVQALQGEFGNAVEHVHLGPPWKWSFYGNRHYIVYSVLFRRKQ